MSARPASQPLDLRGPWVTSPRPWGLCSALPTLGRRQESAPLCPVLLWTTGWGGGADSGARRPGLRRLHPQPHAEGQAHLRTPAWVGTGDPRACPSISVSALQL